jgi:hypothetical protein
MELWLIAAIFGGFALFLVAIFLPKRHCPECKEPLPRLRVPTSWRQFVRGGWTCPGCDVELDHQAKKIGP